MLVNDPSGTPIQHEIVQLEPWKPCFARPNVPWATLYQKPWPRHETLRCPKAIFTTHTAANGRFVLRAPAGHYLLVIGSDDPADLTHPTIHDNVWLKTGTQHLLAPKPCPTILNAGDPNAYNHCLPPIPNGQLTGPLPLPKPERDGDYRLATINRWEKPCIHAFDAYRKKWNLDPAVVDEWVTESERAGIKQARIPNRKLYPGQGELTEGFGYQGSGNRDCANGVMGNVFFGDLGGLAYSADPRTHWVGTMNEPLILGKPQDIWLGNAEYPRDPRNWKDPAVPIWP